jgi:phosphoglycerate dehydrogenase-like enzyme
MKILVTAPWSGQQVQELQTAFPEIEFVVAKTPEAMLAAAAEAEVVLGRISREDFLAAKKLRWIQSTGAGVEWLHEIPELAESDVIVTNTRGAHAVTIAEHTFGMLVCLARGFVSLFRAQQRRTWLRPPEQPPVGLSGLTMGIIGLGQIGRAIAERAHAFGMRVIAVDAHEAPRPAYISDFWLLEGLPELLRRADVVVVATPYTPETEGMLGLEQLSLMKPSAYLLVVSRGGIVDETALVKLLQEERLAGAGLDVQAVEPVPEDSPLWDAPNLIITPHCSGMSKQTTAMVVGICRDNLTRYLNQEWLTNLVDKQRGY